MLRALHSLLENILYVYDTLLRFLNHSLRGEKRSCMLLLPGLRINMSRKGHGFHDTWGDDSFRKKERHSHAFVRDTVQEDVGIFLLNFLPMLSLLPAQFPSSFPSLPIQHSSSGPGVTVLERLHYLSIPSG